MLGWDRHFCANPLPREEGIAFQTSIKIFTPSSFGEMKHAFT